MSLLPAKRQTTVFQAKSQSDCDARERFLLTKLNKWEPGVLTTEKIPPQKTFALALFRAKSCYDFFVRCMNKALSPLDGRYQAKVDALRDYFSEEALFRYRCLVEIKWLELLSTREDIPACRKFTAAEIKALEHICQDFSTRDVTRIRTIEASTNHDVKAIEYFLKEKIATTSLQDISEWIHFSLTSEDVNNIAYALMLRDAITLVLLPELVRTEGTLFALARDWKAVPMLSRTHGQPASPTTMGKEFLLFAARLRRQREILGRQEYLAKLAGASGNFNAHIIAIPGADWLGISEAFVTSLGLTWNPVVAQIEPHDFIAEIAHAFSRIGTIYLDFSRDIWGYISLGFFHQKTKPGEVGSSVMPHKINPIDFENAEGNLGLANALFAHFAEKLPISRWQRDLSDSTVLRNLGVAFGHFLLALMSLQNGIAKLELIPQAMARDLEANPEVLAEAIQSVLRVSGYPKSYEMLKELTRGKRITLEKFQEFLHKLELPDDAKNRLLALTPQTYSGLAAEIVDRFGSKSIDK